MPIERGRRGMENSTIREKKSEIRPQESDNQGTEGWMTTNLHTRKSKSRTRKA